MNGCLTLDVGNTNASLAFVSFVEDSTGRVAPASARLLGDWGREDDEVGRLSAAILELDAESFHGPIGISAVGSHDRERRLAAYLGAEFEPRGCSILVSPDAGLAMEIDHPETCGSDRQYAMRGALGDARDLWAARRRGPLVEPLRVLVVDAGTALTVDAGVLRPGARGSGSAGAGGDELAFLGGAIAMGPGSLARSIQARGARLAEFEPEPDDPALGRSTVQALRAGVSVGFRGAVRELCHGICEEAFGGTQDVTAYLTGGARAFARGAVAATFADGFHETAHLVHVGLARAIHTSVANP